MTPADTIAWAQAQDAAGQLDAMGHPFTSWLLARHTPEGRAMRNQHGEQVFESQGEFMARSAAPKSQPPVGQTLELFA
jgi:hypothetical protein